MRFARVVTNCAAALFCVTSSFACTHSSDRAQVATGSVEVEAATAYSIGRDAACHGSTCDDPIAPSFHAERPKVLGMLVGYAAEYARGVNVYGSDMASSFEHDGKVVMLFGDTFDKPEAACVADSVVHDDMVATLPLALQGDKPVIDVVTEKDSKNFRALQIFKDGQSLELGSFQVPITGFSDGDAAYAVFQAQVPVRCGAGAAQGCPDQAGVTCVSKQPMCQPAGVSFPAPCELLCLVGQCTYENVCVDTRSSEYDGSARGQAASVMSEVYIGKARAGDLATYDTVATWKTNKFAHPAMRTVAHFSGTSHASDYQQGYGSLLVWGRPSMVGEQGRQAQQYFAFSPLPLTAADGEFAPRYYAGCDPQSGEPIWSDDPASAAPLAMDGQVNGDPSDPQSIVTTATVSWLPEPINRWVMLYGGDLPPSLLADAQATRSAPNNGSILMRFALHPWGPWSPATVHYPAGSPAVVGDAYGPNGIMFHPACVDQPNAPCAKPDPYFVEPLTGRCLHVASPDWGRLYSPAIIDAYTKANATGGLDVFWSLSTWAPYSAVLMQTSLNPD